jgi:hypothetical protein
LHPTVKAARTAGAVYLLETVSGPFSLIYVPSTVVVSGNAAATAANLLAHETLVRFAMLGDLWSGVISIVLMLALYRLLGAVDHEQAVLMVVLGGVVVAPIFFLNSLNWFAALTLAHGESYLGAFTTAQQQALAMLFLRLHGQGNIVNGLFWGLWLFPFGSLVMKSGFLPRWLGLWLLIDGVAYVLFSITGILAPHYRDLAFTIGQPAFFGEVAIALYLVIKGANVPRVTAPSTA